jgi:enediyne biosynthesis protein E4
MTLPATARQVTLLLSAALLASSACRPTREGPAFFELLSPRRTGVTFENRLPEDTTFNILNYLYYYNGGGVAAGDVNGDGLPDLYFTANVGANRLYLNRGDYRFEDVTERAGVGGAGGWTTGVTMADVNGDGRLDLYVSGVSYLTMRGRNVLYVNAGDGTFTDRTEEFGLQHVGYSTQAAFFDYDGDGDLDMYLLNHSTHTERTIGRRPDRNERNPRAGDRLFRNDGGRFTDVSAQAGIFGGLEGFGLGVVASDLDLDGCPDLYVANDFQESDFLYHNNCDGTFTEVIAAATGHTSRFSMGVDAADMNNDGRPDLITVDMLPQREEILKTSANAESYTVFDLKLKAGYHAQYARNALQLNRGGGRFSDIGYLAGVSATDWSWAPLFADLDNDGLRDLFVTNGIYRRPNDLDYINYVGNEAVQASLSKGVTRDNLSLLSRMPQVPLPNYAFRNNGDLTFSNMAPAWGLAQPGFSNGAVYVDLNNSGALDLVVNNVNAPASIYRNRAREVNGSHYLTITLRGEGANTAGIGARVVVRHGTTTQSAEQMPTRGFQSSVDPRLHFGLGTSARLDTLTVIWPDHRFQTLVDVSVDRVLTLEQKNAAGRHAYRSAAPAAPLFAEIGTRAGIDVKHAERTFLDYNREPLMPHLLSREGPALAVADANADGLDDVYVGGATGQPGRLYLQQRDGRFHASAQPSIAADSVAEDVDAAFFDANGDGHPDLVVASGGNELWGESEALRSRLYLNDGAGRFRRDAAALPAIYENASCVVPGDFDGDGDVDLFVGSRVVARRYGVAPTSHLLANDGRGRFTDVVLDRAPELAKAGMVTDAAWIASATTGRLDLVVVGEWMPVRVFRQEHGRLVDRTAESGLAQSNGWWNTVAAVDLRGTGRTDLVLGNLGLNSYIRATSTEPARLYVSDFARNGSLQQVLTFYKNGVSYPMAGRDELVRLIPSLRSRYPSYKSFGASRVDQVFTAEELAGATVLEARTFASALALADGKGHYTLAPLPAEAQLAPVYAVAAEDYTGDGRVDLVLGGNFWGVTPARGRYDASYGLLLRGDGNGAFAPVDMAESGLVLRGEVRDLATLRAANGETLTIAARNDSTVQVVRARRGARHVVSTSGGH